MSENDTLRTLVQQMQILQTQMPAMASQHSAEQENIRHEMGRLQAENVFLREQVASPLVNHPTSAPEAPKADGNIKVEEFHSDRGAKYRTFKNHLLMKFDSIAPQFQLKFLASRCFGTANDFARRFTDPTHRLYDPKPLDAVLQEFDQRFQGADDAFATNGKIDVLCKTNSPNYKVFYNKFVKLQDTSSYDQATLKLRFISGLPADMTPLMLTRMELSESLTDLQNHVNRYWDLKEGATAWQGHGPQGQTTRTAGPAPMDLDQVDLEALIQRPFRPLNDADRRILAQAGRWFCCRRPGFDASQIAVHRQQCQNRRQGAGLNSVELDSRCVSSPCSPTHQTHQLTAIPICKE